MKNGIRYCHVSHALTCRSHMAHSPMRASRRQTTEASPWQAQLAILRYVPLLISSCGKPIGATPLPWLYCGCFAHSFHSPRSGSAISSLIWPTASSYFKMVQRSKMRRTLCWWRRAVRMPHSSCYRRRDIVKPRPVHAISAPPPPLAWPLPGAARRSSPWRGTTRSRQLVRRRLASAGRSWHTGSRGRGGSGPRAGACRVPRPGRRLCGSMPPPIRAP